MPGRDAQGIRRGPRPPSAPTPDRPGLRAGRRWRRRTSPVRSRHSRDRQRRMERRDRDPATQCWGAPVRCRATGARTGFDVNEGERQIIPDGPPARGCAACRAGLPKTQRRRTAKGSGPTAACARGSQTAGDLSRAAAANGSWRRRWPPRSPMSHRPGSLGKPEPG